MAPTNADTERLQADISGKIDDMDEKIAALVVMQEHVRASLERTVENLVILMAAMERIDAALDKIGQAVGSGFKLAQKT